MASAHFPQGVQQNRWRCGGCQSHTKQDNGLELAPPSQRCRFTVCSTRRLRVMNAVCVDVFQRRIQRSSTHNDYMPRKSSLEKRRSMTSRWLPAALRALLNIAVAGCVLLTIACASAADLSIAVGAAVTSIDPHYHNLTPNNNIAEHIFETLVTKDPKSLLKPALAVSWKAIEDLTWEFKLRKGVKFHDGSDFTAADVVFSIERTALVPNSPSPFTLYTNQITEKIIIDPLTIRLKTAAPYPLMPNDMGTVFIVSSKVAKGATTADFDSGKATVGTGPFKFVRYAKG